MPKKSPLELPVDLDLKTRKTLENYYKKIKQADVRVEQVQDGYISKLRLSFESYNKKNRGFMEVTCIYANG